MIINNTKALSTDHSKCNSAEASCPASKNSALFSFLSIKKSFAASHIENAE